MENTYSKTYIWLNPENSKYKVGNNSQYWNEVNKSEQRDGFSFKNGNGL